MPRPSNRPPSATRPWAWVLLAVVTVIALGLVGVLAVRPPVQPTAVSTPIGSAGELPIPRPKIIAAWLGDSWIGGSDMGARGDKNWSVIVSKHYGWAPVDLGIGGTGYIADGQLKAQFGSEKRKQELRSVMPDVVIVANGINDLDVPDVSKHPARLAAIRAAADKAYTMYRQVLPKSTIVVFGMFPPGYPSDWLRQANGALKQEAEKHHLLFFDPSDAGFFEGKYRALIGSDNFHPTDAGDAHLADEAIKILDKMGATRFPHVYKTNVEAGQ